MTRVIIARARVRTREPFILTLLARRVTSRARSTGASLSGNVRVFPPTHRATRAGKCGPSISLCIQERDFGTTRPASPRPSLFRRSLAPSLTHSLLCPFSRSPLSSGSIEGAKKKTDDFTFALRTLQFVPEILDEVRARRFSRVSLAIGRRLPPRKSGREREIKIITSSAVPSSRLGMCTTGHGA